MSTSINGRTIGLYENISIEINRQLVRLTQVPFDRQDYVPNQPLEKSTNNITDYSWHRYSFKKGRAGIKMLQMIRACNGVYENLKHGVLEAGSQKQTVRKYLRVRQDLSSTQSITMMI